jgi:2-polyprenyl-3-methyl-5-hydroxy-6-metoxy-1,4-benzoquinol methylase
MNYSPIAGDYNRVESEAKTLWLLGYQEVLRFLSPPEKKNILDFGCGTGIFSRYLHHKGAKVTGVDISKGMIEVAKKNSPGCNISYYKIKPGDLHRLENESFDHVVSNFVLCTIQSENMIRNIIGEIFRVLRKNGTFILMNSDWEESNGREFVSFSLKYCDHLTSGCRVYAITKSDPPIIFEDYYKSKEEYRLLLEQNGFVIEAIREPLAPCDDSFWLDEKKHPPYFILVGRKKS